MEFMDWWSDRASSNNPLFQQSINPIFRIPMIRRKWITLPAIFLLLFAVCFFLFAVSSPVRETILLGVGNLLIVSDDLQPADLIHVLGGGDVGRVDYGVTLYKQGLGKKMFFTGGRVEPRGMHNLPAAFSSGDYAELQGVNSKAILSHGSKAANTYEEAVALRELLDKDNSIRSVIIVSTPYHLQRARWIFNKMVGYRVDLQYAPVPFAISQYKQRWWEDKLSLAMVKNEYLKLMYYFFKY
jgi:uncharacterized SAM-binding protein YcdF (DUF218 family)